MQQSLAHTMVVVKATSADMRVSIYTALQYAAQTVPAVTGMHICMLTYWQRCDIQGLISYTAVGVNAEGRLDPEHVRAALTDATCLVSIMHSNNEVGSLQPIAEIARITRQHNILLHSDAAQSIGKVLLLSHLPSSSS